MSTHGAAGVEASSTSLADWDMDLRRILDLPLTAGGSVLILVAALDAC